MTTQVPGHVPGSDQRSDLRVVQDEPSSPGRAPQQALGLLENARRVADSTVAEARAEAERLLGAARERAAQVQRDAKELGQRLRGDAEREAAQVRHEAFGEAERIIADARAQVSTLEGSIAGLRSQQDQATATARQLVDRLQAALEEHAGRAEGHSGHEGHGGYGG
jgi:cell division septum initiation protein DivIVA